MNAIPNIIVQLVHIEGPLKGEIQDLYDPQILIGRHPECQVRFPKDEVTLSRKHARIEREGNRFKLVDQSTNGTYVNGQQVKETYLKNGDVITFAEGGPKLSFLTQVSSQTAPQPTAPQPAPVAAPATPTPPAAAPVSPPPAPVAPTPAPAPPASPVAPAAAAPAPSAPVVQSAQVPLAIQYGVTLKSYQSLPIIIGRGANCDFVINHPALSDQQAQIFFTQDQYWIKDLTGSNMIMINGMPMMGQSALQPDMQIALSPQGPRFRFLGGGRLAEIEDPLPEPIKAELPTEQEITANKDKSESAGEKAGGLFKKFFK